MALYFNYDIMLLGVNIIKFKFPLTIFLKKENIEYGINVEMESKTVLSVVKFSFKIKYQSLKN